MKHLMKGALLVVEAETRQDGFDCPREETVKVQLMPGEAAVIKEYSSFGQGSSWVVVGNRPGDGFCLLASGQTWDGQQPPQLKDRELKRRGFRVVDGLNQASRFAFLTQPKPSKAVVA